MDPTIITALAGVLGVILGAVIGGVFALKATKRQIEVNDFCSGRRKRAAL